MKNLWLALLLVGSWTVGYYSGRQKPEEKPRISMARSRGKVVGALLVARHFGKHIGLYGAHGCDWEHAQGADNVRFIVREYRGQYSFHPARCPERKDVELIEENQ